MKKLLKDQYFWYTAISAILAGLFAYAPQITASLSSPFHTELQTPYYMAGYRVFLPIAVLFASWRFGVKGGLIVCFLSSAVILSSFIVNFGFPKWVIDVADIAISFIFCWLIGRQGEVSKRLEKTTAELKEQSNKLKQEIAERKRIEEQYQLISDHTADIIYKLSLKDDKFNFVSPSVKRVLGYTQSEGLLIKMADLITPESYRKQNSELMMALQKGITSATLQLDLIHKDGTVIPCEVHANMVLDGTNQPVEIVGVARDITERKKMEAQLIMQDRLASLGQLTSGMAHEVNNPLTSIIGFSSILLKKELDEETNQDLTSIHNEAMRIAGIIKNLLSFSRKQPQQKQPTDINESIRKILKMRAYEQQVNNIIVHISYYPNLPLIMANSSQLEQVFFNIIINAEFFMIEAHKAGKLDINVTKDGNVIRIQFTDNGPGISEDNIKSIFSPLFTTKEAGRGTGLSLSICQGIINEHGGRISVENENDGGATFIIELPVNESGNN